MAEHNYAKRTRKKFEDEGYFVLNLESIGNGVPDCIVINTVTGKYCFVEFKDEDGTIEPTQNAFYHQNPNLKVLIFRKTRKQFEENKYFEKLRRALL